jgi:hypothetical protein
MMAATNSGTEPDRGSGSMSTDASIFRKPLATGDVVLIATSAPALSRRAQLKGGYVNRLQLAVVALLIGIGIAGAGEIRYVVASRSSLGDKLDQYPLWTSRQFAEGCARAAISGNRAQQKEFCEDGFAGLKPKVGLLTVGIEVELLDSRECGTMASVRVLTGPLSGESGCVVAKALTSIKP